MAVHGWILVGYWLSNGQPWILVGYASEQAKSHSLTASHHSRAFCLWQLPLESEKHTTLRKLRNCEVRAAFLQYFIFAARNDTFAVLYAAADAQLLDNIEKRAKGEAGGRGLIALKKKREKKELGSCRGRSVEE